MRFKLTKQFKAQNESNIDNKAEQKIEQKESN